MRYTYLYKDVEEQTKLNVWSKGKSIAGYDSKVWRHDMCGNVMKYVEYGEETNHGWEIDHIYPKSKGGNDDLSNLQPLQWLNNRKKADTYPWYCS